MRVQRGGSLRVDEIDGERTEGEACSVISSFGWAGEKGKEQKTGKERQGC